jgi:nicotinamidase-related amidase
MSTEEGPIVPEAQPARLPRDATAVAVLDMNAECEDPQAKSHALLKKVSAFLDRARRNKVPIIYTISLMNKGTPLGEVAPSLGRVQDEPIIYPDGFDKFTGGEFDRFLRSHGVKNLVLVGRSTNVAVMYTATAAARVHQVPVVIPMDGVAAKQTFEQNYALHQLNVLPKGVTAPILFSGLGQIDFI